MGNHERMKRNKQKTKPRTNTKPITLISILPGQQLLTAADLAEPALSFDCCFPGERDTVMNCQSAIHALISHKLRCCLRNYTLLKK